MGHYLDIQYINYILFHFCVVISTKVRHNIVDTQYRLVYWTRTLFSRNLSKINLPHFRNFCILTTTQCQEIMNRRFQAGSFCPGFCGRVLEPGIITLNASRSPYLAFKPGLRIRAELTRIRQLTTKKTEPTYQITTSSFISQY